MKLKTLKDMICGSKEVRNFTSEINDDLIDVVMVEELKTEAIKWVKVMEEDNRDDVNLGIVNWIKHFFNITEEDLK